jgi:Tfp pilus assembly major pilin PilA
MFEVIICIVVFVILFIITLYIFFGSSKTNVINTSTQSSTKVQTQIKAKILSLIKSELEIILEKDDIKKEFTIQESDEDSSYTVDSTINLVLSDTHDRIYPLDSIRHVAIHELVHVVYPNSQDHDSSFYMIYDKFQKLATSYTKYKIPSNIDLYPCH